MMKTRKLAIAAFSLLVFHAASASAQESDLRFTINRFAIEGNSVMPAADAEALVAPYTGSGKTYADVQRALEALETGYRRLGYGTVNVYVPEQELNQGVVRFQVAEGKIGALTVKGNAHFAADNIRASVPQLQEGQVPNLVKLSENVQLANENPAKQVEVILGTSDDDGKVNARLQVTDEDPSRFYLTLDDTGSQASGRHRVGLTYQNANMFNRDEVLTLSAITSPDAPDGVKNEIWALSYRWPLYALGDSIDIILADSYSKTPSRPSALLGSVGKGRVMGARYNHYFPRRGEYTSKLVLGLDYKYIKAESETDNLSICDAAPESAGCIPYTLRPLSLTYSGKQEVPGRVLDYYVGWMVNAFPTGRDYDFTSVTGKTESDFYSAASGYRVRDRFAALRFGGSLMMPVYGDWVGRLAVSGQTTSDALVSGERLALTGVNAVRGYRERAEGGVDSGYVVNAEVYTPELIGLTPLPGSLKGVVFYDFAEGRNNNREGTGTDPSDPHLSGFGVGLRYNLKKDISFRYDFAVVADGYATGSGGSKDIIERKGDTRSHFALAIAF